MTFAATFIALGLSAVNFVHALQPIEDALREAVLPLLQNQSSKYNDSAWGFSYMDAGAKVSLCVGYSDIATRTPCSATDKFAWGSTTKVQTAVSILQLVEKGMVKLDDSIVTHADDYVLWLSGGSTSLVSLFGPQIHNVTIRLLLQMSSGILEYDNKFVRNIQNVNRSEDLDPLWILNFTNRTFNCAPGTCTGYSSTNYVILGLVLARHHGAFNWDRYDQRSWIPEVYSRDPSSAFNDMYYPLHGPCSNFSSANPRRMNSTMHGYQQAKFQARNIVPANGSDVYTMSCLQGWTCGNLAAPTASVAEFFWTLLGPPSRNPKTALLQPAMLDEMLSFKSGAYLGRASEFGYGLGMMNFTSMNWGFEYEGRLYGHNGLTYGFGAQSAYHLDLDFAVTWVNNVEHWIGPDDRTGPDPVYTAVVNVVRKYRKARAKQQVLV